MEIGLLELPSADSDATSFVATVANGMTSSSRHVLVLAPLLFGSCVQFHLAATCARGAVVRIWLDLQRKTGLTRAVVYRLSISPALIRASATETSLRAISKFWSTGAGRVLHFLVPKNEVCIS